MFKNYLKIALKTHYSIVVTEDMAKKYFGNEQALGKILKFSEKENYTVTGISFGMKAKEVFPEGWMIISIPYNWIPVITRNLNRMKWVLPSYADGREKFIERKQRVLAEVAEESQNP